MSCSSNGHYYVFQPVKATFTIMLSYTHCFFDWGLNLGPPALEASTIPLGYRGGGKHKYNSYDHNRFGQCTYSRIWKCIYICGLPISCILYMSYISTRSVSVLTCVYLFVRSVHQLAGRMESSIEPWPVNGDPPLSQLSLPVEENPDPLSLNNANCRLAH